MLRPSSHRPPQSPPEYLETEFQSTVTAKQAGYSLAIRTPARSVHDDAYVDSTTQPGKIIEIDSGRKIDRQAIPSFWQQQDRILPSIEGSTHHVDSSIGSRDDNGVLTRLMEQELQPHAPQQNLPILIRSGHPPVVPRIIELDDYDDSHLPKRRKVTDLSYRPSNPVPVVTSNMTQPDVSGSRRGRVEWIESDLLSRRPTQRDTVSLHELEPGSHNQRIGTHGRVQTTLDSTSHQKASLRSLDVVQADQQYQDLYRVVSRSTYGDLVRENGYQNTSSGQLGDRTQGFLEPRAARLPQGSEQYNYSFSAHRRPGSLEVDRTSLSTQLVRARPRTDDYMNVYPMYSADSQVKTNQALHYVRMPEGDQSRPIYINESVRLTPGASASRQATTRDDVMRAKEYVRYEQIPEDEHLGGKPYPTHRRTVADETERPPAVASEIRNMEDGRSESPYYYTYGNATKVQPLLRSYNNNATPHASSEEVHNLPGHLPFRAEQRR